MFPIFQIIIHIKIKLFFFSFYFLNSYRSYFPQDFEAYLPLDRNAPPTYTPVMSSTCPHDIHCNSFITPTPPPTYAQAMGASEIEASPDTVLELMVTSKKFINFVVIGN